MKPTKYYINIIIAVFLTLVIPATVFLVQQQQIIKKMAFVEGGAATLELTSEQTTYNPGEPVDVNINLDTGGEEVQTTRITIEYDTNVFERASEGGSLVEEVDTSTDELGFDFTLKNEVSDGRVRFDPAITGGSDKITGSGVIGTLKLKVKNGTTNNTGDITFITDGEDESVILTAEEDVLGEVIDLTLDIETGETPTNTPTGSITATPTGGATETPTESPTSTPTGTITTTPTTQPTQSPTPSPSPTGIPSGTPTPTPTPAEKTLDIRFELENSIQTGDFRTKDVRIYAREEGTETTYQNATWKKEFSVELDQAGTGELSEISLADLDLANKTYEILIKTKQHLQVVKSLSEPQGTVYTIDFETLLAGDLSAAGGITTWGDNKINSFDIVYWQDEWSPRNEVTSRADINGDERVNALDYGYIYKNYGLSGDN